MIVIVSMKSCCSFFVWLIMPFYQTLNKKQHRESIIAERKKGEIISIKHPSSCMDQNTNIEMTVSKCQRDDATHAMCNMISSLLHV